MSKPTGNSKHVHKYRLTPLGGLTKVWSCGLPFCNHYQPAHMAHMMEGKGSECWDCSNVTVMSADRMNFAVKHNEGKILCQDCMDKRRGIYVDREEELVDIDSIIADMKAVNKR